MKTVNNVPLIKPFNIKPYNRDDVYRAVGKITEVAQKWESLYRECAKSLGLTIKDIERKTLVKINEKLFKSNKITKKEHDVINESIKYRNEITHTIFSVVNNLSTDEDWDKFNKYLNAIINIIYEAMDVVTNIMNKENPYYIKLKTIHDDYLNN